MSKKRFSGLRLILMVPVVVLLAGGLIIGGRALQEPGEVRTLKRQEVAQTDEGHQEYYFGLLNENEQRGYREILEGIRSFEDKFYLSLSGDNEIDRVYHAVLKDHPELFWVHNRKQVYKTTFSNANYCMFSPGYSYTDEEIQAMDEKAKSEAWYKMWRNFCVSDTFEPGSTIKPFTVATGLEIGALKGDEIYYCGGSLQIDEWEIKCISYDNGGHGQQNLTQVMENSCNVALMQIGLAIGPEEFCKYQSIFGFGQYTGIDLPGEAVGILQSPDGMIKTDLATNSFGQNFNVTMLQLATGFCSLINGGDYYEPHLVKAIQDENGNVIQTIDPVLEKKTISKETSDKLKSYMYSVVQNGSGRYAQVEGYDIGGKTGTAEKLPRGENKNVVSFIGYAPQENPEIMIYVVIDEPNAPDQSATSSLISQLASDIMAEAFPYLNITKAPAE